MHAKNNYPFTKETSDVDIALENNTDDEEYLNILKTTLPKLINKIKPNVVFYQCGVDILTTDKLGKLSCTINGCKQRDQFVLETFYDLKIPVICSMGGGYSKDIKLIVEAHCNTYRIASDLNP